MQTINTQDQLQAIIDKLDALVQIISDQKQATELLLKASQVHQEEAYQLKTITQEISNIERVLCQNVSGQVLQENAMQQLRPASAAPAPEQKSVAAKKAKPMMTIEELSKASKYIWSQNINFNDKATNFDNNMKAELQQMFEVGRKLMSDNKKEDGVKTLAVNSPLIPHINNFLKEYSMSDEGIDGLCKLYEAFCCNEKGYDLDLYRESLQNLQETEEIDTSNEEANPDTLPATEEPVELPQNNPQQEMQQEMPESVPQQLQQELTQLEQQMPQPMAENPEMPQQEMQQIPQQEMQQIPQQEMQQMPHQMQQSWNTE